MDYELQWLKERVGQMLGDGDISLLFNEIRKDIANKILDTPDLTQREFLYMEAQGCKRLEQKFQEYLNDLNRNKEYE